MMLVSLIAAFFGSLLLNCGSSEALQLDFYPRTVIRENVAAGSGLTRLRASGTGTISYSIIEQRPSGLYQIDGTTGSVTVCPGRTPDADDIAVKSIKIRITDAVTSMVTRLTVTVNDVNDNRPAWSTSPIGSIGALAEEETRVTGNFIAFDGDISPPNYHLKDYTLECDSYFHIDPITALLTVKKDMTGPDTGCYYSKLYVSDMGVDPCPLTGSTTLFISVNSSSCTGEKINMCSSDSDSGASSAILSLVIMATALLMHTIQ